MVFMAFWSSALRDAPLQRRDFGDNSSIPGFFERDMKHHGGTPLFPEYRSLRNYLPINYLQNNFSKTAQNSLVKPLQASQFLQLQQSKLDPLQKKFA
jgi:hypothetical protein